MDEREETLMICMQKEIAMMREILATLYKEELCLQLKDQPTLDQTLQQRAEMVSRLSSLRQARLEASTYLETLKPEETSCEILSMRDQILALIDRTNTQQARNQMLEERYAKSAYAPPSRYTAPAPQAQKKKAILATYPEKH